jgi:methyl-accepting chemotaxis protein
MLNNLGIRGKLFASFGGMIGLMAIVGGVGWYNTHQLGAEAEDMYRNQLKGAVALANSESAMWKLRYGFPQFIVDPSKRAEIKTDEPKQVAIIKENFDAFRNLELTPEETQAFKDLETIYNQYVAARPKWFELIEAGKIQEAATHRAATTTPYGKQTVDGLNALINLQREVASTKFETIQAQQQGMILFMVVSLLAASILAVLLTLWLSGSITKPVLSSVNRIASSSNEIAATVEQQERTVNQQAASVNQTSTTMGELGASSRQASEQAEASAAAARQALSLAEDGTKSVESTVSGIENLRDKVRAIAEQIMRLSEQTGQIAGISDLVADLANQTNMLALNAAVEAARAGEQGKGFSVVASEIRKLADESKKSAEKINALVMDVQASMNSTVMVTDEGTKTANEGIKLAQGTAEVFTGMVDAINNVFVNNQQISLSAKQQAIAVEQVLEAMNSVNLGAKETATGISQVKVTTNQLSKAAEDLKRMAQQVMMAANA